MIPLVVTLSLLAAPEANPEGIEFFEKKIRPVLVGECYSCHSSEAKELKGSLRLDSRPGARQGGATAAAVVPGSVSKSLLIAAIRREGPKMPPDKALPASVIADFARWIEMGAPDPRDTEPLPLALEARRDWWSLHPLADAPLPDVSTLSHTDTPVDRFILRRLAETGLEPSPPAGRHALLRRLSFVLRGGPPTPAETERFVSDVSVDAYEQRVDEMLGSPSFGERWARHWMDVIGYSETQGHEWNPEVRGAWRYRDYLIRAFNGDLPYDDLLREHLAGDLLEAPRWDPVEDLNESVAATAFLRFGEVDHDDCRLFPANFLDTIDHQIDTISKGFQATTVSCARCHDHKLDAVSMRDYYALSGVLSSARHVVHTLDRPDLHDERKRQLSSLKGEIRHELLALWTREAEDLPRYARAAFVPAGSIPAASIPVANDGTASEGTANAAGLNAERLEKWKAVVRPPPPPEDGKKGKKKKPPQGTSDLATALRTIEGPVRWLTRTLAPAPIQAADGVAEAPNETKTQDLRALWQKLAARYDNASDESRSFNEENFTPYEDFRAGDPTEWTRSGFALAERPSPSGEFSLAPAGEHAVAQILQAGFHSHTLSNRLNASLRSPLIPKTHKYISVEVAGDRGAMRQVYENCSVWNGASKRLKGGRSQWIRVNTEQGSPEVNLTLSLVTRFDDYGYPGIFATTFADLEDIRSHFSVRRAVLHDVQETPKPDLSHLDPIFDAEAPTSMEGVADLYSRALATAVLAWARGETSDTDALWLDWALRGELLSNHKDATPRLQELVDRYRAIEEDIPPPRVIAGVTDFERGFDVPLRIAGEAERPGQLVPRGYLHMVTSSLAPPATPPRGSGRLELAAAIASAKNPLTARVMVNRIWHYIFGFGLVRTPDDFGHLGDLPTHPELLDHIAGRFVASGWSMKELIREFVLTQAFRSSTTRDASQHETDPENYTLHHYPLRRLEGEAIRDAMLAVSGRIDRALYGPSIDPYRTEERPNRKLLSGPIDGNGRRSIYTRVTLTEQPPFLATFNLPDPKHPRGRRDVTNVPSQALTLLNNPFVLEQAALWAKRLILEEGIDEDLAASGDALDASMTSRIDRMFREALGRPAEDSELVRFTAGARNLAKIHGVAAADLLENEAVWTDMGHLLFNLKEFIYLR